MATFSRTVSVDWTGTLMDGKGQVKAGTGAFDVPRARATLRDGELTIVLPKLEEERRGRAHRIPIGRGSQPA